MVFHTKTTLNIDDTVMARLRTGIGAPGTPLVEAALRFAVPNRQAEAKKEVTSLATIPERLPRPSPVDITPFQLGEEGERIHFETGSPIFLHRAAKRASDWCGRNRGSARRLISRGSCSA